MRQSPSLGDLNSADEIMQPKSLVMTIDYISYKNLNSKDKSKEKVDEITQFHRVISNGNCISKDIQDQL